VNAAPGNPTARTGATGGAQASAHPRATTCRNCGAPAASNYCPDCGQDTSLHPLSVWEFVHEIVAHYVAAEGKLWRTLALLALQPGRLTLEYLAGRRQRYIVPLRLYLTASFLFFALAQLSGHLGEPGIEVHADAKPAALIVIKPADRDTAGAGDTLQIIGPDKDTVAALEDGKFEDCLRPEAKCTRIKRLIAPAIVKLTRDPQGVTERFAERFRHSLSYAMFFLLPIFALLLSAAYRKRKLYYGEHLVFALHVHSFWFFLAILTMVLPESAANWLPLGFIAYGFWALQRVYGGRWWATLLRGMTVMTLYALIMGIGAAGLSLALLATV
jgi:hypothetical protein